MSKSTALKADSRSTDRAPARHSQNASKFQTLRSSPIHSDVTPAIEREKIGKKKGKRGENRNRKEISSRPCRPPHSSLELTFFKLQAGKTVWHLATKPSHHQFLLPTGRPPTTPASRHSHQNPNPRSPRNSNFRRRAFRDDCIELQRTAAPHGTPQKPAAQGWDGTTARPRYLRRPLDAHNPAVVH